MTIMLTRIQIQAIADLRRLSEGKLRHFRPANGNEFFIAGDGLSPHRGTPYMTLQTFRRLLELELFREIPAPAECNLPPGARLLELVPEASV